MRRFVAGVFGLLLPCLAHADSFTTIGTLSGTPYIGAAANGILYGTDPAADGHGVLFSLSVSGTYTLLYSFTGSSDGAQPNGGLALSPSGTVFGTAQAGGAAGGGVLFAYSLATGYAVLHGFGQQSGDGYYPLQGPVLSGTGALYGTAMTGGVGGSGTVWEVSPKGKYVTLYDFLSGSDGHCPYSGVSLDHAGDLFGTVVGYGYGGNPNGSVWKITRKGVFATMHVFGDGRDGEWPDQAPVADAHGNLFGTTHVQAGNKAWAGAIWEVTSGGVFKVLYNLNGTTDGSVPNAPLFLNTDGYLYGTTAQGGLGYGTLFRVSSKGKYQVLHSFSGGSDGAVPTGSLAHDENGVIYGGTNNGVVFSYTP